MRYHYMDFARSIFMTLGIISHSSLIFTPNQWRVQSAVTHEYFSILFAGIYSFRMHSFYLIAGFFAAMLIGKYPPRVFFRNRIIRLAIPMFFWGLTLNSIMHALSRGNHNNLHEAFNAEYWVGGDWLGHLWFIANLLIYVILFLLVYGKIPKIIKRVHINYLMTLILIPLSVFILIRIGWRLPHPPFGNKWLIVSIGELFEYLPYFTLGIIIYKNPAILEQAFNFTKLNLSIFLSYFFINDIVSGLPGGEYLSELLKSLHTMSTVYLLLYVFNRFFNTKNKIVREISDSSYTIYLVHQPLIVILSYVFLHNRLNIFIQFTALVVATWTLAYLFHKNIVARNQWIGLLMNGSNMQLKKNLSEKMLLRVGPRLSKISG